MYTILLWIMAKCWVPNLGVRLWAGFSSATNYVLLSVNKGRIVRIN